MKLHVKKFIAILKTNSDTRMTSIHEAGHMAMWHICFPEKRTVFEWTPAGLPSVREENSPGVLKIGEMPFQDAMKHLLIKLAGYSAEMIEAGIAEGSQVEDICRWMAADYFSKHPRLDWKDDEAAGGDLPCAAKIIAFLADDPSSECLRVNMRDGMNVAISHLRENWKDVEACAADYRIFALTR